MTQPTNAPPAVGNARTPIGDGDAVPTTPDHARRLDHPATVDSPKKIRWNVAASIAAIHAAALAACFPWFFSWSGVIVFVLGAYCFGTLGINLCYHRLLTHRGFKTPRWLEHSFAVLGMCSLEGSPASWVAAHRMHHQHADVQPDPHSPLVDFFWSHISWLVVENHALTAASGIPRYARDVCRDPFYFRLERRNRWLLLYPIHAALFFLAGTALGWVLTSTAIGAVQLGLSWVVWGVLVRTVVVWHITWSVNSFTHLFGYRNYNTGENSRNNWIVALLSNGEGWHNNHHADQRSASHGHKWWELDVTYLTILALRAVGLAKEVVQPQGRTPRKI